MNLPTDYMGQEGTVHLSATITPYPLESRLLSINLGQM